MTTSQKGIDFILAEEGFSPTAYADGGFFSIGYGHQIQPSENYLLNSTITREQAEEIFKNDLKFKEKTVNDLVNIELEQNQFDALVSLVYNIGSGNFGGSSVLKSINSRAGQEEIKTNWRKWNKSQGNILDVLVNRRERELGIYFQDVYVSIQKLNYIGWGINLLASATLTAILYFFLNSSNEK